MSKNNRDKTCLVNGKYSIEDLVDLDQLRGLFEKFTDATGFTIGFLNHPGMEILIGTGWRDICTKFHRGCPASNDICIKSNRHLLDRLDTPGKLVIEPCENGLVDCATPIIIQGKHIASLATGQLLLKEPNLERFKQQAQKSGFDERGYLKALQEIPVIGEEKLRMVTRFLGELAQVISELGYTRLMVMEDTEKMMTEIAERKRAEETLRESEEKYKRLIETTGTGYVSLDDQGRVVYANTEYLRMTGRQRLEEIMGHSVLEWTASHDFERNDREVRKCFVQGFIRNLEIDYVAPGGKITPIEINATMIHAAGTIQILTLCHDITERKRAEETLRKEKEFNETLVQGTPAFFVAIDSQGKTIMMNAYFLKALGYTREEAVGKDYLTNFVPESDREKLSKVFQTLIHSHENTINVNTVIAKDGREFLVEWHGMSIFKENGELDYFYGIGIDISERKRAEEEKAKLESQLQQSQRMEAVGRLAGGVAHDFNNMLGVILGRADIASERLEPAHPVRIHLEEIRKAARRSSDLTKQLLAFARKQTITPKVLDLNETVEGMITMLQRLIGEDIQLNWCPKPSLWLVNMDPSQIDQVLANLCLNARDAIADVGKITIETENRSFDTEYCDNHADFIPGDYVCLAVSDTGSGMEKETLTRIFEPFFTTKETGKGTGLGLSTVYGIVKQNNGFINVYSELGHGTTFTIYLPRHQGKVKEDVPRGAITEPALCGHETILLVEDDLSVLEMIADMLTGHGYAVLAANTPGEAVRIAAERSGEFDLLMTDVIMPEMNGRDLAKKMLSLYPHLKCLFMSGYTANVIAHHGVLNEGVNFIQKPFSTNELITKVQRVFSGK